MGKWLILGVAQEQYKVILEYLLILVGKKVLKNKNQKNQPPNDGGISKGHSSQLKGLPMVKTGTI